MLRSLEELFQFLRALVQGTLQCIGVFIFVHSGLDFTHNAIGVIVSWTLLQDPELSDQSE